MKISVVTVCYNAAETIADSLESVARQTYPDVEHLLVDGCSNDGTVEIARRHGAHLTGLVSESDRGIYDAMNKGAALSRGDVLGFLNADDWYADGEALASVAEAFSTGADLVYGDLTFVKPHAPFQIGRVWLDSAHEPRDFFRFGWQPAHPTTFVRRELFEMIGGFDLRWRIGADYAFLGRVMQHPGIRIKHIPRTLVNMRLGGTSTNGVRSVVTANIECAAALQAAGHKWPWLTISLKLARKVSQLLPHRSAAASRSPLWRPWDA